MKTHDDHCCEDDSINNKIFEVLQILRGEDGNILDDFFRLAGPSFCTYL